MKNIETTVPFSLSQLYQAWCRTNAPDKNVCVVHIFSIGSPTDQRKVAQSVLKVSKGFILDQTNQQQPSELLGAQVLFFENQNHKEYSEFEISLKQELKFILTYKVRIFYFGQHGIDDDSCFFCAG